MGHISKIRHLIVQKIEITLKNEIVIIQKEDQEIAGQADVIEKEKEIERVKINLIIPQTPVITSTTLWLKIKIKEAGVPTENITREENERQTN